MDGLRNLHTKRAKSERERQISYDTTYMCYLIKMIQKNLFTKLKQIQRFQNQIYSYQRGNTGERDEIGGWD